MILMNDFKRQWADCGNAVLAATERVGRSGWYILGTEVDQFESALAGHWGIAHAVGVASGLDAIEIALRCMQIQPGDRVLTTPLSAFATTLAIVRAGGVPVFCDVDALGQLGMVAARRAVEADRGLRMAVPVHLFGFATGLPLVKDLVASGLKVVEDCAQAIGASHAGITAGSVGQLSTTSFYPTKNLGALGDGGAVLTNDRARANHTKQLRNYGQSAHYAHDELGLNSRLDELHAAILREAFLPKLLEWTKVRRRIARRYLDGIQSRHVQLLQPGQESSPSWHLFPVLVAAEQREGFRAYLKSRSISTGVHYPLIIPDQAALRNSPFKVVGELTNARRFAACEVSLPIHPYLTDDEIQITIDACNEWTP